MLRFAISAAHLLPACSTLPAASPELAGTCRNDGLDRFIGQPASAELGVQMLAASGARVLRWAGYGMAITMDFSPNRLTVRLTQDNRVESASCG
jgi:hypothetical protein